MNVLDAISKRKTIRDYEQGWKCPKEHLETIAELALLAPSTCNFQSIDLLVITNQEILDKIGSVGLETMPDVLQQQFLLRKDKGYKNVITCDAPVLFILVKNERADPHFYQLDAGIMVESILLASLNYGYGTMCISALAFADLENIIGVPKDKFAMAIAMGKPAASAATYEKEILCKASFIE
ncbi:nitroreductase family protein [Trichomonas vaginalis G3]|uniref:Nitroreductase family protein n=1 Tax=Trichomonas vaginalis (strain ATCC PRA-98 / G3) TaxID=412133 RepID=A2DUI1_TRIV3|nr:nitroreductase family protein [Trichomonas vaginalis G3]EAY15872.1 nitroreductase family protein [Trichomonas vaginalis G3]KAI5506669.1 nitroreductase family protein [Trichomonas vaginalis G3]|eukprot:XP_001328095.1 nitroreductase family protein [Trichomonas vaginalis G3]